MVDRIKVREFDKKVRRMLMEASDDPITYQQRAREITDQTRSEWFEILNLRPREKQEVRQ